MVVGESVVTVRHLGGGRGHGGGRRRRDRCGIRLVSAVGQAVLAASGPAFGIAWTILYVLLAGAGARALDRAKESPDPTQQRGYLRLYAGNLVLNAGWTWSFFRAKRPPLAVAEVVLLLASRLELTRRTYRLDRAAGTALLPYTGWTIFATALSAEIARRNRPGG